MFGNLSQFIEERQIIEHFAKVGSLNKIKQIDKRKNIDIYNIKRRVIVNEWDFARNKRKNKNTFTRLNTRKWLKVD